MNSSLNRSIGLLLVAVVLLAAGCTTAPPKPSGPGGVEPQLPVEEPPAPGRAETPEDQAERDARRRQSRDRVVIALLDTAQRQSRAGDLEAAAASLERGLRISPRNAVLWQRLASVRLEQGRYRQAEQLAAKSNALAGPEPQLRAHNWEIIAQAREFQGDSRGAAEARRRARDEDPGEDDFQER